MDERRQRAYRTLLSAGLLHLKWDLACWLGQKSMWVTGDQRRAARRSSLRARAFHNLAIFAENGFENFDEHRFWRDIEQLQADCPNSIGNYKVLFERCLRGEAITIIAPDGIGTNIEL